MTLKKFLFSGAALAAIFTAQSGLAADLPSAKAPPPPPVPAPVFSWTGFYAGFSRGYGGGFSNADVTLAGPGLFVATNTGNRASGFTVGGQLGYNYQFGNLVLGLETDMQWSDIKASHQATTVASAASGYTYADIRHGINWFGTTRGRLGYAFGRVMPYVTGGVAYGEVEARGVQAAAGALISGARTETTVGWAAGAGAEVAVTDNVTARAEYVYVELPGVSGPAAAITPIGPLAGSFSTGALGAHIFRGGANWKFNGFGDVARFADGGLLAQFFAPATTDWNGLYAGVNGGYGGGVVDANIPLASAAPFFSNTLTNNRFGGFAAGGQLGYNHQFGQHIVVGLETDMQWSDVKASHQATTGPDPFVYTDTTNGLSWFGTTRARLGWAFGNVMYFATGGVAYGELTASGTQIQGGVFTGSTATTKAGWTVGGGAEYALTQNLALKADYLYSEFSGVQAPAFGFAAQPFTGAFSTGRFGMNLTRIGLNWRFGAGAPGAAPILAKY